MADTRDRILLVENDPVISDLVGKQALQGAGYQYFVVSDANTAISRAIQLAPDVIIIDLNLPGLSGKDMLVALTAQGIDIPIIVMAQQAMEADIIEAFRLGASDYMIWPLQDPEIVNVVERALKQVHERREREKLAHQLQQLNQELQSRVRELTTIYSVGKAVTSITDQSVLFEKIVEGALKVTQADMGWFLMRGEHAKAYLLVGGMNLPASLMAYRNQSWDDGISSLVAMSGEPLSINGEPLKRFKISSLGQSVLIVPVKAQKEVIGLLVMVRKQSVAFSNSDQHLLEAVTDYASISLVNAHLFRALEERAQSMQFAADNAQAGAEVNDAILQVAKEELRSPLEAARATFDRLSKDPTARWNTDQREMLGDMQEQLQALSRVMEAMRPTQPIQTSAGPGRVNLNELLQQTIAVYQPFAQVNEINLLNEIPSEGLVTIGDSNQLSQAVGGLISNAIRYSNPGGRVAVRLEKTRDGLAHIVVSDHGIGIESQRIAHIFEKQTGNPAALHRFAGLSVGLPIIHDIVTRQNGKVWVESKVGQGAEFHITLSL
jgi:signal transduction histidine kinase/DNA-binding response OmpR family regulator